ncbi:MAG: S8 family peptidase [Sphingomonas sp.]
MDVTELFDIIDEAFGRSRFLQHSPISPDVWEEYIDDSDGPLTPDLRCDLLMTAASGSEPGQIAGALRNGLNLMGHAPGAADVAANVNSVVARLTLDELVCSAAPLSAWWQALPPNLKQMSSVRQALRDPHHRFASSNEVEFFAFAATAGLVHLLMTGRGQGLVGERARHRDQSPGPGRAGSRQGQRRRSAAHMVNPDILEMLGAFDELCRGTEFVDGAPPKTAIDHIYPNRRSQLSVAFSRRTIKADASENLFHASTAKITWAVVDSGVDATHPCFETGQLPVAPDTFSSRVYETYDFTRVRSILSDPAKAGLSQKVADNLLDRLGQGLGIDWSLLREELRVPHDAAYPVPVQEHGTHVAGIIGANWPCPPAPAAVLGVCPDIRLLDIRVFDAEGTADEFTILSALQFLGYLNTLSSALMVHGANLSFSLVHKVRSFACGRTPVCDACDRMVKDGIVVVAAAGNAGYTGKSRQASLDDRYSTVSITDPGNAEAAITVGSTHKISPYGYGVSYFSSRGPTGDGRAKPDILAPGEKILSALPGGRYGEMDGTSMAAPHVSGAAAILLARYPELIGRPALVKQILCKTAVDLGRERAFQGAGLVDILHALQASWQRTD